MSRFASKIVFSGFRATWFLAASPINRSVSVNATYDGVVRFPCTMHHSHGKQTTQLAITLVVVTPKTPVATSQKGRTQNPKLTRSPPHLVICDDLHTVVLPNTHTRVGRSQIDTNSRSLLSHGGQGSYVNYNQLSQANLLV